MIVRVLSASRVEGEVVVVFLEVIPVPEAVPVAAQPPQPADSFQLTVASHAVARRPKEARLSGLQEKARRTRAAPWP